MPSSQANQRHVIISADCHAGADLRDYKPILEFLQRIADHVGFTPAQVREPLTRKEIPHDPNFGVFLGGDSSSMDFFK